MTVLAIDSLTKDEYKHAFLSLQPLADHELELLGAHFRAPNHTITASELATAVGDDKYGAANLHYGKLAGKLCEVLGCHPRLKVHILVTDFKPNDGAEEHWHLVLRPQVVEALLELGWFSPVAGSGHL
jgi:hypothetical protein